MQGPKRKLKIKMSDLESAFEHRDPMMEIEYYLDLETGEVLMITGEDNRLLKEVYENYADPETGEVNWPAANEGLNIRDWQKTAMEEADRVSAGLDTRYIPIPPTRSYEGYTEMVDFIETVSNRNLQRNLQRAISGRGAFRYFKDVLTDYPKERQRWFEFQAERMRQRVQDWLEEKGIELIE